MANHAADKEEERMTFLDSGLPTVAQVIELSSMDAILFRGVLIFGTFHIYATVIALL